MIDMLAGPEVRNPTGGKTLANGLMGPAEENRKITLNKPSTPLERRSPSGGKDFVKPPELNFLEIGKKHVRFFFFFCLQLSTHPSFSRGFSFSFSARTMTSTDNSVAVTAPEGAVNPAVARGAFIVLEGLDRSGKTTQVQLLQKRLVEAGKEVKSMRFPGTLLCDIIYSFTFLFLLPSSYFHLIFLLLLLVLVFYSRPPINTNTYNLTHISTLFVYIY